MVFYAHLLQEALDSPTIVVITDRNDLDDQLYGQFAKCKEFLRQEPIHAESRENLKSLLAGRQANGIIFTTMQKFEESHEALSERNNIIVMADEAHRGQYGLAETVDAKTGKIKIGTARIIRNTLPNATYIGFTGTPISSKDRSTREVFGDYIDIYDMTQAVEDGATRPVYYESRVIKLNLDEDTLKLIDSEYDIMAENADGEVVEKSKRELGKMEAVLGNDNTINSLVCDILDHYENNRENLLTGKAMIVAYSRPIAMKIYKRILELRPAWTEKVGVVMTSGNNDPEEWRKIIGNKHHKDELAKKFKDNNSPMKIAIVVDMWLTGFDVPSLATMYVYKPMSGHNLMQAIARVNRVFRDKEGGLVVDYVGIASALKQAMNDYTSRDKKNYGDTDVAKVAYPKFLEKLSVCRDMFHGYDYSKFTGGTDLERAKTISGAVNFIMDREKADDKDSFVKEALMLHQALSLCSSLVDEGSRFELFVRRALEKVKAENGTNSTLKRSEEVFLEEINWIEKMGIKTLDEYEKVERVGRFDTRIIRENRKYFFQVYKAYLEVRKEEGYLYDWEDIAQTVYEELDNDTEKRMYKHIIVDEGQDLSPIMLKSLVKAIPEDGTFTFFGDVAQQIYGSRLSWREAGLKIVKNKIWYFDRNYRNSKEIAKFAVTISKSKYFEDKQDLVEPVLPTASSPLPAIVKCKDEETELEWIVETAIRMSGNQSIAILVRNRELVDLVEEKLRTKKIIPQILKNRMGVLDLNAKISIGTFHSAKGLEFDMVFLPFCSVKYLPSEERILANEGRDEALKEEAKLLYVAITRAKRGLILSYTAEKTELLLEVDESLYDERELK